MTAAYVERQCYEYMKLGLAGVTILYSSGDYGWAIHPLAFGTLYSDIIPVSPGRMVTVVRRPSVPEGRITLGRLAPSIRRSLVPGKSHPQMYFH